MILSLIILGVFVGIISSFFGVGGGILVVPALFMIFEHISPQTVIGSSLGMIFFNSLINLLNFIRHGKKARWDFLFPIMLSIIPGVIIGGLIINHLSPKNIKILFAFITTAIAIRLIFKSPPSEEKYQLSVNKVKGSLTGLSGGLLSGLTGLGGGAIMVPMFITFLKVPIKDVSFYSNCIMPVGALIGALTYSSMKTPDLQLGPLSGMQFGELNLGIIFLIVSGVLCSSKFGVKLGQKVSKKTNQRLFAALLIIVSSKIFYTQLISSTL